MYNSLTNEKTFRRHVENDAYMIPCLNFLFLPETPVVPYFDCIHYTIIMLWDAVLTFVNNHVELTQNDDPDSIF